MLFGKQRKTQTNNIEDSHNTVFEGRYHYDKIMLLFVDFETTSNRGIDCDPIEGAFALTTIDGKILDKVHYIYKTQTVSEMVNKITDPVFREFYTNNGLIKEYEESKYVTYNQIDSLLCFWIDSMVNNCGFECVILVGYACFLDRQIIQLFHPKLYKKLYYKTIDIASVECFNMLKSKTDVSRTGKQGLLDSRGRVYHRSKDDVDKTIETYNKLL